MRATSVISTSGAGISLETPVAGTYLLAMLAQSCGPGDHHASVIERADFQRTARAAGFDDVHLHHRFPTGGPAATYVQIKRTLTGRRSEDAFRRPVADAARLIRDGAPGEATFRIVASRSAVSPRDVDRACDAARLHARRGGRT